ncbi:MAG: hypothetical protein WDW36_009507 [Sanguina aurantia]
MTSETHTPDAAPLPGVDNPNLAGSSNASGDNFKVSISNKSGYLCRIHLEATFDVPPDVIFALFTYPDNSALFRDVKRVGNRSVLSTAPGLKVLEVEQLGELKVMWMVRAYSTTLKVVEDSRDPDLLITQFDLERSDMLSRFSGRWELSAVRDPVSGRVSTCSVLTQDVLPKGVPPFLQHVPVLGSLLRGVSSRAITRLMADINQAVVKVKAGMAKGQSVQQVLRALCGTFDEAAFTNGAVASFAIGDDSDSDDERSDEAGGEGHNAAAAHRRDSEPPPLEVSPGSSTFSASKPSHTTTTSAAAAAAAAAAAVSSLLEAEAQHEAVAVAVTFPAGGSSVSVADAAGCSVKDVESGSRAGGLDPAAAAGSSTTQGESTGTHAGGGGGTVTAAVAAVAAAAAAASAHGRAGSRGFGSDTPLAELSVVDPLDPAVAAGRKPSAAAPAPVPLLV